MLKLPGDYRPRLVDEIVDNHLAAFGAVEIAGTMWSGKTWTSLNHGNSERNLDEPETRALAELAPEAVLDAKPPLVVDEWQLVPSVWDAVRRKVDAAAGKHGLFILTGSSRPAKDSTAHSGAGRISRIRMWPMSLQESGESDGSVSISALFDGAFSQGSRKTTPEQLAKCICRGGWPAAIDADQKFSSLIPTQYIDAICSSRDSKAPENERILNRFLQSLARNMGSAPKIETLVKDMGFLNDGQVSEAGRKRIRSLLDYFNDRFVIDETRGWDAPIKSPQRLRSKPHYNFADPSIPASLLGVDEKSLFKNMQLFGQLFEQMCLRDLRIYTSVLDKAKPDSLQYYRDADGLEVDAIIELRDGRWAGIEIKLNPNKVEDAESNLLRLKKKVLANPAAQNAEPSFLLVLTGVGQYAYQLPSGVYVAPIAMLGA